MAEIADKMALQQTLKIVQAAAAWEHEAGLLSTTAYEGLQRGLAALAAAIDVRTPAVPADIAGPPPGPQKL